MAQKGLSQADKRRDMNLRDQFGRLWLAAIEKESFEPTGHLQPAGWSDPLRTPSQYLRIPRDEYQNPQIGRVEVDFKRWQKDQTDAMKEWKIRFYNIGREQKKHAFDPAKDEQDEYLLHLVGPKPWPAPAIVAEAAANKTKRATQFLGLADLDRDTRMLLGYVELEDLEAIANGKLLSEDEAEAELKGRGQDGRPKFNTGSYKEFTAACLKRGITMKKAAELWKDLKAATGETVEAK